MISLHSWILGLIVLLYLTERVVSNDYAYDANALSNPWNRGASYGYVYNDYAAGAHRVPEQQYYDNYAAQYAKNRVYQPEPIDNRAAKSGYKPPPKKDTKYVPVVVKQKKKKQKIMSITKGVYIPGGVQVFGKFKSLKGCMKACGSAPTCFAGDYNPWLGKCYFHSNLTACAQMQSHKKTTHFKKIPCTVTDAPSGRITLGASLVHGLLQKGIDNLSDCLKKCANAGGGIAPHVTDLASDAAIFSHHQICFGIDYDFATHKCYFHTQLYSRIASPSYPKTLCPTATDNVVLAPLDLQPHPSTINILLCPATMP